MMTDEIRVSDKLDNPDSTALADEGVAHAMPIEEPPGSTMPKSTYELVVVAAREARRINERLRRVGGDRDTEKVTTRAAERVRAGQVRFAYEEEAGT